jgi:hypothetical protein
MYIQEKNITEDLAVWARPFAFHSYAEFTKKKSKIESYEVPYLSWVLVRDTLSSCIVDRIYIRQTFC